MKKSEVLAELESVYDRAEEAERLTKRLGEAMARITYLEKKVMEEKRRNADPAAWATVRART